MTRKSSPFERVRDANPVTSPAEPDWARIRESLAEETGERPARGHRASPTRRNASRIGGVLGALALLGVLAAVAVLVLAQRAAHRFPRPGSSCARADKRDGPLRALGDHFRPRSREPRAQPTGDVRPKPVVDTVRPSTALQDRADASQRVGGTARRRHRSRVQLRRERRLRRLGVQSPHGRIRRARPTAACDQRAAARTGRRYGSSKGNLPPGARASHARLHAAEPAAASSAARDNRPDPARPARPSHRRRRGPRGSAARSHRGRQSARERHRRDRRAHGAADLDPAAPGPAARRSAAPAWAPTARHSPQAQAYVNRRPFIRSETSSDRRPTASSPTNTCRRARQTWRSPVCGRSTSGRRSSTRCWDRRSPRRDSRLRGAQVRPAPVEATSH